MPPPPPPPPRPPSPQPTPLRELDVVLLSVDVPTAGLVRGRIGTIVHVHAADSFEVEFVRDAASGASVVTLRSDQLARGGGGGGD